MNTHSAKQPTLESSRSAISPTARICKAGACVAVLAVLALIGASNVGGSAAKDPSVHEAVGAAGAAITGDRAAAHRRELFEERRVRFEERTPAQVTETASFAYPYP